MSSVHGAMARWRLRHIKAAKVLQSHERIQRCGMVVGVQLLQLDGFQTC
jgi:hypothetical protein